MTLAVLKLVAAATLAVTMVSVATPAFSQKAGAKKSPERDSWSSRSADGDPRFYHRPLDHDEHDPRY